MQDLNIEQVKHAGYVRGRNIGENVDMRTVGEFVPAAQSSEGAYTIEEPQQVYDQMVHDAFGCEENDRQFTPFEFTASALNKRDDSEAAWEAYEAGISMGITEAVKGRLENLGMQVVA